MSKKAPEAKQKKNKSSRGNLLLVGVLLLGVAIMAYPTVSDRWNTRHASRAIASYTQQVESTDTAELDAMIEAACAYNLRRTSSENPYAMQEEDLAEYNALLDLSGNGLMGTVRIPSINVTLPVYHGTSDSALQTAAGHLEWTSLPVGGEGTHAVISGHRGLPSARLFTDLDKLREGERFTLTVLNQTLTYEVDQIRIVEPADVSDLLPVAGQDYCTLVTCTPYGINTHRMLVRGHRVENESREVTVQPEATVMPNYLTIPAVAIPLLFITLAVALIATRRPSSTGRADLRRIASEDISGEPSRKGEGKHEKRR